MFSGKRFKLRTSTIAIDGGSRQRVAVTVPAGSIITVVSGPTEGTQMIDVLLDGRPLTMFVIDVRSRGEEIADPSSRASG